MGLDYAPAVVEKLVRGVHVPGAGDGLADPPAKPVVCHHRKRHRRRIVGFDLDEAIPRIVSMHAMADGLTVANDRDLAHIPSRVVGDVGAAGVDLRYLVSQPAVAGRVVIVCEAEGGAVNRDSRMVPGFRVRPDLFVLLALTITLRACIQRPVQAFSDLFSQSPSGKPKSPVVLGLEPFPTAIIVRYKHNILVIHLDSATPRLLGERSP